ncbi:LamG-like jellyroll fold domain-containing protein [Streptomyces sp. Isolate_45]|uniref:LamG-like jellyroll fold domain-containing protein n=1 Tax=Streptomyces sp. Isolate_45 TaxID=2950111 RepID=UPI002481F1A7|nr:LamG-like jellyroll fold domain-containing protein [Streptomyces sp. Isolate_45]MDA5279973.1 ricin-type beta-trefoil lectin domain protein [Streptomyces sp. Isolate_45]
MLAGLVTLALSITSLGAAPGAALAVERPGAAPNAQTPPPRPATQRDQAEEAALAEARRTGKPVPIPAFTTETDTTVANPNGTLGLTRSVAPLRTRHGDTWVGLDATLVRAADGKLRPKAATNGLTLSAGGTGPLAVLEQDGKRLVLSWPDPLPAPALEGESAIYREVAPGTDLKVAADESGGISQVLVVNSAQAAQHPKLAKLTLGLKGEGVAVSADGHGNLKAADTSGRTIFQAPTPTMWDSSTPAKAPAGKAAGADKAPQLVNAPAPVSRDDEAAKYASDSVGPGDFAKVARLRTDLGKESVDLTPDPSFLNDPNTAYPVYIDPAWTPTNRGTQHWAWVQEAYPATTSYDDYGDTYDPGVGYQRWRTRTGLERYYVQVDTGDLRDKTVRKASFFATQSYAADATCSRTYNVDLHSTEPLLSNITWNTQPRDWEILRTTAVNSAGGPGCTGSTTRGEWDVRDHLIANEWRGSLTYGLFAADESKTSGNNSFKRFTRDKNNLPFLYVEYNRAPYPPWSLGMSPAPQNPNGNGCGWVGATTYASLSVGTWIGDPDSQPVSALFNINDTADGSLAHASGQVGQATGTHWVSTRPTGLLDGHTYNWRVAAHDGELESAWVTGCTFSMDLQPPSVPVVTSPDYPPSGSMPGSTKHIGRSGTFGVRSADTTSGVLYYEWAFNSAIPAAGANRVDSAADGSASIPLTPTTWGTNLLRVQAVDRAGNRSQQQTYAFYVPDDPNAKTTLGDITGDERVDFIAPTSDGDLVVYPTALDPAAGGIIASNLANSPGGKGWGNGTLTTHRGGNSIRIDDLWAYRDGQLTLYRNSLTQGGLAANDGLYYSATKAVPVQRPYRQDCTLAATGQPCGSTYVEDWTRVHQILAVGDALPEAGVAPRNDLLTVEKSGTNSSLVLFQGTGATGELRDPVVLVLSPSGWDNLTLIAPGDATGDGLPDLWARDKATGEVYQYANVPGNPAALGDHSKRTRIGGGVSAASHPVLGSSGDTSADGTPDLWALDSRHRLLTWNGTTTTGRVTGFGNAQAMGDSRISAGAWKLNEGSGTAVADLRGNNSAALTGAGATWADDTVAGTATKVVDLDGGGATVTAAKPGVDTSRSFTVSTWVKADKAGGVVVSQDGQRSSGFMLWSDSDGTWRFALSRTDGDGWNYDQTDIRNSAARVQVGVWTQLMATYDDTTGLIALYVNGTLAATGHHAKANTWQATGPLVIGRYKAQGNPSVFLDGRISGLAVHNHSTVPSATRTSLVSGVSDTKCVDDSMGGTADGNRIQIWDCNGSAPQQFELRENGELRVLGRCVDAPENSILVQLWTCNGTGPQQWLPLADGSLYNPMSKRCMDLPSSRTDNGIQLQLWECNGTNAQLWSAPGLASPLGVGD